MSWIWEVESKFICVRDFSLYDATCRSELSRADFFLHTNRFFFVNQKRFLFSLFYISSSFKVPPPARVYLLLLLLYIFAACNQFQYPPIKWRCPRCSKHISPFVKYFVNIASLLYLRVCTGFVMSLFYYYFLPSLYNISLVCLLTLFQTNHNALFGQPTTLSSHTPASPTIYIRHQCLFQFGDWPSFI